VNGKPDYLTRRDAFLRALPEAAPEVRWRLEFLFEGLRDECLFGDAGETLAWYHRCIAANQMASHVIPLLDCRKWSLCPETGALVHDSHEFFRVEGIRTTASPTREVQSGWDQPILTQVGYDGGILGLLRRRFEGVPHYLVEAKAEPGNYKIVQITTTIQATFSNLKRAHLGVGTPYSEYFTAPSDHQGTVLIDQWMSEDGGRLNRKRNRTMLVEIPEERPLPLISDRYRWVSLYQLKHLLKFEDAIVAPHVRGVLAVV
jgi:oxidase EvaA